MSIFLQPHLWHAFSSISSSFDDATGWLFKVKDCILFSLSFILYPFSSSSFSILSPSHERARLLIFISSISPLLLLRKVCGKGWKYYTCCRRKRERKCNVPHSLQSSSSKVQKPLYVVTFLVFFLQMRLKQNFLSFMSSWTWMKKSFCFCHPE